MKYPSVAVAIVLAATSAGGAVACYARFSQLRTDAQLLLARGSAQAAEYASTFNGQFADQQEDTFQTRRAVLERSAMWRLGQLLLTLLTAVLGIAAYCLFLMARLREQVLESTELDHGDPAHPIPQGR